MEKEERELGVAGGTGARWRTMHTGQAEKAVATQAEKAVVTGGGESGEDAGEEGGGDDGLEDGCDAGGDAGGEGGGDDAALRWRGLKGGSRAASTSECLPIVRLRNIVAFCVYRTSTQWSPVL